MENKENQKKLINENINKNDIIQMIESEIKKNIKDIENVINENIIKEEKSSNNNNNYISNEAENKSKLSEIYKNKYEVSIILIDRLLTIDSKNKNVSNKIQKINNNKLNKLNSLEVENIIYSINFFPSSFYILNQIFF